MIYIVLIIGLGLIFISLKNKKNYVSQKTYENNFDDLLEQTPDKFYEREIVKSYIKLEDRVIKLEKIVNMLQDNIEKSYKEEEYFDENLKEDISSLEKKKEYEINDQLSTDVTNSIKSQEVIALYNEGRSVEEIASTLKIGKGEVLLRIGLQKRGK